MGYKQIIINNNYKLSLKNSSIHILNIETEETNSIPLEDIDTIIINNNMCSLSALLLSEIGNRGIALYICDKKQVPIALMSSFNNYHRQNLVLKLQIDLTESFKSRLWQEIVKSKINNQATVLKILEKNGYKELKIIGKDVKKADETNREAYAAKMYFKYLFDNFKRGNEDTVNIALNYGYTILRGCVARYVVAHGFAPSLGLHHKNQLNNYNLADDLIEPFRPFVDLFVYNNIDFNEEFSKDHKRQIVNILNNKCIFNNKQYSITEAINLTVNSLYNAIYSKDIIKFATPSFITNAD